MKLLIQNGRVVDPVNGTVSILDLYVENGKVLQLEKDIQTEADRVIDATGLVVCPGLVDLHVHLRVNISKGSRKSLSINLKTYSPSLDVDGKYISLDGE